MNEPKEDSVATASLKTASFMSGFLVFIKLVAFFYTGSLLVLASLFDSIVDTFMSLVNFKVSRLASEKADREHPFGHGGAEVVAALVQGSVIAFFGLSLFIESIRVVFSKIPAKIENENLLMGAGILAFSSFAGYVIQRYLDRAITTITEEKNRSLALEADRAHYLGDVLANLASALGLLLVWYTDMPILDSILGGIAALFLVRAAYPILKKSYLDIMHHEADPLIQKEIVDLVLTLDEKIVGIHNLRSRELGPNLFIDFHLSVKTGLLIEDAHELEEMVEREILKVYPRADIFIHLDPESEPEHQEWEPSYHNLD